MWWIKMARRSRHPATPDRFAHSGGEQALARPGARLPQRGDAQWTRSRRLNDHRRVVQLEAGERLKKLLVVPLALVAFMALTATAYADTINNSNVGRVDKTYCHLNNCSLGQIHAATWADQIDSSSDLDQEIDKQRAVGKIVKVSRALRVQIDNLVLQKQDPQTGLWTEQATNATINSGTRSFVLAVTPTAPIGSGGQFRTVLHGSVRWSDNRLGHFTLTSLEWGIS
jgi:hypothetical protein